MRKRKNPMPPMHLDGVEYRCRNADFWPPPEMEHLADSAEQLRYTVPDVVYQRLKTWERVCGTLSMNKTKCLACPLLVVDGKPVTRFGSTSVNRIKNKRILRNAGMAHSVEGGGNG